MKKRNIIIGGIVLTAVGVFAFLNMSKSSGELSLPINTETVKRDTIVNTVSAKGEVSLLNSELIYSSTTAEVGEVLVEKNDEVKAGDVLIRYTEKTKEQIEKRIRDAELNLKSAQISLSNAKIPASESTVESAKLSVSQGEIDIKNMEITISDLHKDIEKAKKDIADAEKSYADTKALFDLGAVSKESLEKSEKAISDAKDILAALEISLNKSETSLTSLEASQNYKSKVYEETLAKTSTPEARNAIAQMEINVQQAQIILDDLKKDLEDFQYEIISPISGTVTMVNVSKGEIAPTEKALMEISDTNDYIVKVDVNERNAAKIALGQEVEITGSVLGKNSVYGVVTKISNIAEQKQTSNGTERVVSVEIEVTQSEESKVLKPGFSLDASITTEVKENAVVVPILATLKDKDGSTYVYVVKEDNTLEKRIVELGLYADMNVEASNIEAGEEIVSQPGLSLYEGMVITPVNADEITVNEAEVEG